VAEALLLGLPILLLILSQHLLDPRAVLLLVYLAGVAAPPYFGDARGHVIRLLALCQVMALGSMIALLKCRFNRVRLCIWSLERRRLKKLMLVLECRKH
jgi:hypothetical protein